MKYVLSEKSGDHKITKKKGLNSLPNCDYFLKIFYLYRESIVCKGFYRNTGFP